MCIRDRYSALASALAELAGQVYQTDVPDKRKARRLEQLFSEKMCIRDSREPG